MAAMVEPNPMAKRLMNSATFLTWLENAAIRFLISSPRIGFVAVKQINTPLTFVARSTDDTMQADFDFGIRSVTKMILPVEPLSRTVCGWWCQQFWSSPIC